MMTTAGTRGPYAKTEGQRQAIAAAALDLIIERGHEAITTTEIAARAGMQKSAAMYHFPSKDHMLVAALVEHERRTQRRNHGSFIRDIPVEAKRGVQRDRIVHLYQAVVAESHDLDHPAHEYFRAHCAAGVAVFGGEIRRAQEEGLVPLDIDPEGAARSIVAVWDGLQMQWLNDPGFDVEIAMRNAIAAIAPGLPLD